MISRISIVIALFLCITVGVCWADASSGESEQGEQVASTQGVRPSPNPTTVEAMLEQGNTYQAEKDYENALLWFNTVISQHPDKALEANFNIGWCYQEQGKYTEAIAAYNAVMSFIPADTRKDKFCSKYARYNLGDCYRDAKSWDAAIALYEQLVEDYPTDAGSLKINLGSCYKGKGDYEKAMAVYEQVVEDYPSMAGDAHLSIDDCYSDQQKNDDRLAHLNKMYDDYPDQRAEILFRLGLTRGGMKGEYEQSIADLEHMVADYPDFWRVAEVKAAIAEITLNRIQDLSRARALLEQFIVEYPDYGDMIFVKINLAESVYQQENYLEAANLYEDTLQYDDPGNCHCMSLYMIADCYRHAGDLTKAKETLKKLVANYPSDCWAILARTTFAKTMKD